MGGDRRPRCSRRYAAGDFDHIRVSTRCSVSGMSTCVRAMLMSTRRGSGSGVHARTELWIGEVATDLCIIRLASLSFVTQKSPFRI